MTTSEEAVVLPPETTFYLSRDGQTYGPHSLPEIHSFLEEGAVQPVDFAWTDGMEQWISVGDLLDALGHAQPAVSSSRLAAPETAKADPPTEVSGPASLLDRHASIASEPDPDEADSLWVMPGTVNAGLSKRLGVSGGIALLVHLALLATMTLTAPVLFKLNEEPPPVALAEPAPLEVAFIQEPQDQPPPPPPPPDTPPPPPPPDPPPPPAPPDIPLPTVMTPPAPPVDTPPPENIPPPSTLPALPSLPAPVKIVAKVEHRAPPQPQPMVSGPIHAGPSDYLVAPKPDYPYAAKQRREQGRVMILVQIDEAGYVTDASVSQSSGYSVLDQSAQRTVKEEYRFRVGNSRQLLVPIDFRMP